MRFLSHRNMMSLCERAAGRAKLPVKFSGGFNPRPRLSLPVPRPVGLSSCCELLVMEFDGDFGDNRWPERFGGQFPCGMKLLCVEPLQLGGKVKPGAVTYELTLTGFERDKIDKRLAALNRLEKWEVLRRRAPSSRKTGKNDVVIDIRDRIGKIGVTSDRGDSGRLTFTLKAGATGLIGPGPVLELLELRDKYEILARMKRTKMECEF